MDIIKLADGIFFNKMKNIVFLNAGGDIIYYKKINNNFVCTGSKKHGKNIKISDELYDIISDKLYLAQQKLLEFKIAVQ